MRTTTGICGNGASGRAAAVRDHPVPELRAPPPLKVRTDNRSEFLSPEQVAEAEARFGPHWESGHLGTPIVSFQLTQQQRLYLALKPLAVAQGRKPWFLLLKLRRGGYTTIE